MVYALLVSKNAKTKLINIIFAAAAAIVTLILMTVLFNPFKFKEPVWHITQFLNLNRLIRPIYERNVDVNYTNLFKTLYFLNIASIII